MANPQAERYAQQAGYALQRGEHEQALQFIDQAIGLQPEWSDHHIVRGVVLAQLRRPEEATEAFGRSVELAPNDPKTHYNLAVHLHSLGALDAARECAQRALSVDSRHGPSARLMEQLGPPREQGSLFGGFDMPGQPPAQPTSGQPPYGSAPQQPYGSEGYQPYGGQQPYGYPPTGRKAPGIAFVRGLGTAWDVAIWLLIASSLVLLVFLIKRAVQLIEQSGNVGFDKMMAVVQRDSEYNNAAYMSMGIGALMIVWMIVDIIDKGLSMFWLIPAVICCCLNMPWLLVPIYFFAAGRR